MELLRSISWYERKITSEASFFSERWLTFGHRVRCSDRIQPTFNSVSGQDSEFFRDFLFALQPKHVLRCIKGANSFK